MATFDPELRRFARFLPRGVVAGPRSLRVIRALTGLAARRTPTGVEVHEVGEVRVRLHRPPGAGAGLRPGILWIHGGGMVLGTAAQDDRTCRRLAKRHGAVVAAVDYRLAPEHPHPTPVHDCYEALVWLAGLDGVDAARVAVAGASAGGGLAASVALLARERGEVQPVAQVLVYPMLDDRTATRTGVDEKHFRLWNLRANRFGWESYTGKPAGAPDVDPLAAPARHDDLAGLPPAWIGVGDLDLFHDEDVAYAERLREAGVACDVHIAPGAFHGFEGVNPKAGVSQRFIASQDEFLDRVLTA